MTPSDGALTGGNCLPHQARATGVCARCGAFMCDACTDVAAGGVQLLASAVSSVSEAAALKGLASLTILFTVVALPVFAYRTARALGSDYSWLWSLLVCAPCVGLLTLLVLSSEATAACRKRGIQVGLLGPKV